MRRRSVIANHTEAVTPMSNPVLARNDDAGDRFYTFGDPPESFFSVTTIIGGGVPKHSLPPWYARMAAELAYDAVASKGPHARAHTLLRMWAAAGRRDFLDRQARGELKTVKLARESERDLALRWLKGAADRYRDAKAAAGTAVHDEAEELVLVHAREATRLYLEHGSVKPWPEALAGYETSFRNFIDDWHPEFLATEATVINRTEAYGGTLDSLMRLELLPGGGGRRTLIVDYKSGNQVYPTVGMQLAALSRGEFLAAPDGVTELPIPAIAAGAVLHLLPAPTAAAPRGYRFRQVRIDPPIFDAFRYAREVFRFNKETARSVFIRDLVPPQPVEEVA